jgi:multidrug efflux pump subunit AcrA (membrane-fusion protein)
MKKIFTYLNLLFIPFLLFACGNDESGEQASTSKQNIETIPEINKSKLQLFQVNAQTKEVNELISGRVIAKNQTQLVSEVQGLILPSSVMMKAGVRFRKGDQLIAIDSREFSLNLKSQKSAFLNALTGIMPDLKSDYSANFQIWLAYLEKMDLDLPLAELPETKSSSEKFFITSRGIYTSFYGLKAQEERLNKYVIYAPYSGIITQSMVDIGGLVSPGMPLGTIINTGEFELEAGASLKVGSQLKVGDKINFSSNEVSGNWTGIVSRIGGVVDIQTQNVPIYFRLTGNNIIPGMYLQGQFNSDNFSDVFVIPNTALSRDQGVLVLEKDLIVSKSVEAIAILQDSTLVRGLAENDQVILTQFAIPMAGKKVVL